MILCACIHHTASNTYYPGLRHDEIVKEIVNDLKDWPMGLVWGFIDEEGNFHDRVQALMIAVKCGQYGMGESLVGNGTRLHSEDIY